MTEALNSLPVISVESVSKQFPGIRALDDVSLALFRGQVHGIVGENGAGKSTLMKILSGIYQPSSGVVKFNGGAVSLAHAADAQKLGIVMIHQELNLVDELSVAENIFLGREPVRFRLIDHKGMAEGSRKLLASLNCDVSPAAKVKWLSVAQRQMVEIAKALSYNASVVIMDEPTAVLSRRETEALFAVIQQLRASGVGVVYISHILPEVLKICDRVTVLRDGRIVQRLEGDKLRSTSERELAGYMVGREMQDHFPRRMPSGREVVLEVRGLRDGKFGAENSFEVHRGEILGFAGLIGAGRTELAETIVGLRRAVGGEILVNGRAARISNPRDAVRAGIAYLSEDRKGAGLTLGMSVTQNTTLVSLKKYCHPLIDRSQERAATAGHVEALNVRLPGLRAPIGLLSGGNQQKIAIAKWLEISPKVLIVDEPTRGVDIGAKEQIYALLQKLTQEGMGMILISSELNEVLGMSHRIAVMRAGMIVKIVNATDATEDSLMQLAVGVG